MDLESEENDRAGCYTSYIIVTLDLVPCPWSFFASLGRSPSQSPSIVSYLATTPRLFPVVVYSPAVLPAYLVLSQRPLAHLVSSHAHTLSTEYTHTYTPPDVTSRFCGIIPLLIQSSVSFPCLCLDIQ